MTDTPAFDEHSHAIQSVEFDYGMVESQEIKSLAMEHLKSEIDSLRAEAILKTLHLIIDAKRPRLAAYQLAYACGCGAYIGGSAASVARKFGITRQDFEQTGNKLLESLEMRKNPIEKSESARRRYSMTNYRQIKP